MRFARALALLIGLGLSLPCVAARYALLVGVGQYPALPPGLQLQAPPNDVRLMRQVLLQRGFEADRIEVLADGVEGAGLPTRAAIVAALQGVAGRVRAGDTVYLHFSGHGSLQPQPGAASGSPVAWRPVFLPRDVRAWDGKAGGTVPSAITDAALREWADRINDTGAFVFGVFDACHSARLVRGALPGTDGAQLRVRQVEPAALGIADIPPAETAPPWPTAARPAAAARGQAAYFYAAQSYELATSLPLPEGARPVWHGLFSWHVAQALALGQPMSYRQLGQHLLSRHDQLPASSATPLYGGDGLDQPVFGQQAPLVRQWPLQRSEDRLSMPAGALSGLAEGALLAVVADPLARAAAGPLQAPAGTLGFVRVTALQADSAALEPVAWQGWAAPKAGLLPAGSWVRLIVNPASYALRVAVDHSSCRDPCAAARAVTRLRRDGVPGVDVRWVGAADTADARLSATESGIRLRLPGADDSDRFAWGYAAPEPADAVGIEALVQATAGGLHRIARSRNVLQLAARLALRDATPTLQASVKLKRAGADAEEPAPGDRMHALAHGDLLLLDLRNAGDDPADLVVLWLGADQGIRQVYPDDPSESPRLRVGEKVKRIGLVVDGRSEGIERLLVLTVPMRRGQDISDFRFLEQSPLGRLRGATDPELQALFDACFADYRQRGDAAPALPSERLGLQVFTFRVGPAGTSR